VHAAWQVLEHPHQLRAAAAGPGDGCCPRGVEFLTAESGGSCAYSWAHAAQAVAHQRCQSGACHQPCHRHADRCRVRPGLCCSRVVAHARECLLPGRTDYHGVRAQVCADTLIGSQLVRGISGGQKKRVTTGEKYSRHRMLSMPWDVTQLSPAHTSMLLSRTPYGNEPCSVVLTSARTTRRRADCGPLQGTAHGRDQHGVGQLNHLPDRALYAQRGAPSGCELLP
jgi:hypothetical protein